MIGDSLYSDILGGNANGFKTILVKTGNYRDGQEIPPDCKPTYLFEDVEEALHKIIDLH